MALNHWIIIIDIRKSEVSVERISVCNVIEKIAGMAYIVSPCSRTNDVIYMLP